jgi:acyl-CoA thioester hydrolase
LLHGFFELPTMAEPRPPELADHPVIMPWPVQWGDQDSFGHVNNVVYFRWLESARIEYFAHAQMPTGQNKSVGPILASVKCDYRRQLNFPDTVLVSTSIAAIGRTSLRMVHRIYSTAQRAVVAEGDSTLVLFDYDAQRPVAVSEEIRARIEKLEGRPV